MKKIIDLLPGFLLACGIAVVARFIEGFIPNHMLGASIIALFIGLLIHYFFPKLVAIKKGVTFTSKRILKLAIVLLGASLSIQTVLVVGRRSLVVMVFTLLTCFGGGHFIGKALGLDWKLSNLISAGTGICGGSAIAAIAPVIEAKDSDIAYSMSATFLFDMAMIVLFPIMGRWLNLSDMGYGLWAGTAVNDTSSVVAAGYAFSEAAGDYATMVKLTRTLSIIPAVIIFSFINMYVKNKKAKVTGTTETKEKVNILKLFPWFIVAFLGMAVLYSYEIIPETVSIGMKTTSKFLMVAALAAVGLNTDVREMKKSGWQPMLHGFIVSVLVVLVAIGVEFAMGIAR